MIFENPWHAGDALQRIAWLDWPKHRLAAALMDSRQLDATDFAAKYDNHG